MATIHFETLPGDLATIQGEMEGFATSYGLDFFPTVFEVVDASELNAIAAYGGFPTRYPHWRFGMEYEQLAKGYAYGLQKIYELVINNDPCYAYLMRSNGITDQKLVMAHVYGHCDFFKNNYWFSKTNRKMMDEMANHGNRIRRYMNRFGVEEVENFIDTCLSIEDLIDIHSPFIQRREQIRPSPMEDAHEPAVSVSPARLPAKSYMDAFINPPELLRRAAEEENAKVRVSAPAQPVQERDVMLFIMEHAPLRNWQLDVLSMLRDEAYYFAPQGQTKIMNEGWASYWHSTIMTQKGLEPNDVINYCDHHSGTVATSGNRLNPYKLGIELFRDIEERWNFGRHGKEYDECDNLAAKRTWNTNSGEGRKKIFEVRRIYNDVMFVDEFLTHEFCRRHKLFSFGYNQSREQYEIESREFPKVKERLLFMLTNAGRPIIAVREGNYKNRGELLLDHTYSGVELKLGYARDTLVNLQRLWTRPAHIQTVLGGKRTLLSFDGSEHSATTLGDYEPAAKQGGN